MGEWKPIGTVSLLQIQTGVMTGRGGYDLAKLVAVDRLRLTPDGALGLSNGDWIVDRHHRQHPAAKHWFAEDTVSFGFTSHYEHMWELFRSIPLGQAGENIIVEAPAMLALSDIAGGLRVETPSTGVEFREPAIAEPCVEFTRFMTNQPDADASALKPQREKLRKGVRGFVVGFEGPNRAEISPGDEVLIRAG